MAGQGRRRSIRHAVRAAVTVTGVVLVAAAVPASAGTGQAWPAYLYGPLHSSYAASQTAITPATAPELVQKWHYVGTGPTLPGQPQDGYLASPTVADGAVYIGSDTGWFYKLDEATGAVLAKVFLNYQPAKTCGALGIVDTATVAVDPQDHQLTVYVGSPHGYLFALRASDLSLEWKSLIAVPSSKTSNYFEWSSPTVANGRIYLGVASNCDIPLIRGAVLSYDQATGKRLAEFFTVPKGSIGGSVWSSLAVGPGGDVYATTGNGPRGKPLLGYSESIIQLNGKTLAPLGRFQVPVSQISKDGDFGGSPTLFGSYVGACDKNGIYYALSRSTMRVAWEARIGAGSTDPVLAECSAAAVFTGKRLYFGGPSVTIGGRGYRGSVQERLTSGKLVWETGLPEGVIGTPTADGGGVLAVGTYDNGKAANGIYLVNAQTGRIVRTLTQGSLDFSQSIFAGGWLFTADGTGVYAWGTKASPAPQN